MTSTTVDTSAAFTAADASVRIEEDKKAKIEGVVADVTPGKLKEVYLWAQNNNRNFFTFVLYEARDKEMQESLAADGRIEQKIKDALPDTLVSFVDRDVILRGGCSGDYVAYPRIVSYVAMNAEGIKEIGEHIYRKRTPVGKRLTNFLRDMSPF